MNDEAKQWINRYIDAYQIVTRRINARMRESFDLGLTSEQFQILRLIDGQPGCTSTYLSEALCVGKSSITAMINRLAEAGIIERTRDENDRRLVYLAISENGRAIYETAEEKVLEVISPYLMNFDKDKIEQFITMFERLAQLMQDPGGRNE
ncbi:DNA-binding transcriptional regulator, MarR family [Paenibacillus sophorae]|uniref:DNA-binding transcriptional regulator, MarR family n=1 Tax=Paenibacillus sophorae TaxID=1333845 RepID=A0A1H8JYN2_9BACL|nr:MarR family transcriptional regulator [Paenibacillus sophorae]QWU13532.1 MarR family transcriptional regulator [Paenibacillus sophorae]SEN85812.1 DNA-binding transcriptional regulator, MarR family [Paenibacillus sophorae]